MKKIKFITFLILSILFSMNISAKKSIGAENSKSDNADAPSTVVSNDDSDNCETEISLFYESAKNKNYADASKPWDAAYSKCPGSQKLIYSFGPRIIQWQISQAKTDAEKTALFNKLMNMFDNQIKYFGNDERKPTPWILGMKSYYYSVYKPNDKQTVYPWLKESVTKLGAQSDPSFLQQFAIASNALYKADKSLAPQYIKDYLTVASILDTLTSDTTARLYNTYAQIKAQNNSMLATSGAVNCDRLDSIYKPQIEINKDNYTYLQSTINLFKIVGCTEAKAFFNASVYAYKIKPSSGAANGCAEMCYFDGNYSKAIDYYQDAVNLSTSNADIADYDFKIAQIYFNNLHQPIKAKDFVKLSLAKDPKNGNAYLLLGIIYASATNMFGDNVLDKTVYWAAVDQFVKAKQVDPSDEVTKQANKLINTYISYFPSKEEIFMHPNLNLGSSYYVGGWIGESTICRAK